MPPVSRRWRAWCGWRWKRRSWYQGRRRGFCEGAASNGDATWWCIATQETAKRFEHLLPQSECHRLVRVAQHMDSTQKARIMREQDIGRVEIDDDGLLNVPSVDVDLHVEAVTKKRRFATERRAAAAFCDGTHGCHTPVVRSLVFSARVQRWADWARSRQCSADSAVSAATQSLPRRADEDEGRRARLDGEAGKGNWGRLRYNVRGQTRDHRTRSAALMPPHFTAVRLHRGQVSCCSHREHPGARAQDESTRMRKSSP
jgi:hypothetical protein